MKSIKAAYPAPFANRMKRLSNGTAFATVPQDGDYLPELPAVIELRKREPLMLSPVGQTEFDLHFQVLRIPVRIHPGFWIIALLLGQSTLNNGLYDLAAVWVACVFVSILVHELGHALMARRFGWPPEIVLYHFGGLASYMPTWGHTPQRSIAVSFAGPGAGFLLYGVFALIDLWLKSGMNIVNVGTVLGERGTLMLVFGIAQMKWINLWWGLLNLLPVLPLDGGQIMRAFLVWKRPWDGLLLSLRIAVLVAGLVAFYAFRNHDMYIGILFALLCFQNIQAMQSPGSGPRIW